MHISQVSVIALATFALAACSPNPADERGAPDQPASATDAPASGPFSQVEMQMNERMMAAAGANAADTWVRKMIEHHRGAVEMSEALLAQGGGAHFAEMARTTVQDQRSEMQELERMLQAGVTGSGAADIYGDAERQMHERMMNASGTDAARTWAAKMIEHHRGAVAMAEIVIAQGGNPDVAAMARQTIAKQSGEIEELQQMLAM